MKGLSVAIFIFLLAVCTSALAEEYDRLESTLETQITLTDNQKIRIKGFELKDKQLYFRENSKAVTVPSEDIHKIEVIDRWSPVLKYAGIGTAVGGGLLLYGSYVYHIFFLYVPVGTLASAIAGGATGYAIADKTYYELNPLNVQRQTEYSKKLVAAKSGFGWGSYSLGVDLGIINAFASMPKLGADYESLAQDLPESGFSLRLSLSKRISYKTLVGINALSLNASDANANYFAHRSLFLVGPQITHFPSRYDFYLKGSANLGMYSEEVRKSGKEWENPSLYLNDDAAFGVTGGVGYAFPNAGRVKLTTELSAQLYQVVGNKTPVASMVGMIGLYWY